jgi:hypothetical protein
MEYVMIPVPEQIRANVDQYLRWNVGTAPAAAQWDLEAVGALIREIDEQARALLIVAADASVEVTLLSLPVAAERAGCSVREALGIVLEMNDAIRQASGPAFSLATDKIENSDETGPRGWSLNMPGDVAKFLLRCAGRGPIEEL